MKRLLMTMVLTCVLFVTTLAGEIPTVPLPPPPPQGMTQSTDATLPGEIPSTGWAEQMSDVALFGLLTAIDWLAL